MRKDIIREFLTGPREFHQIMEKLEISTNDMMADDGPVPMDLGNVDTHDAKNDTESSGHEQRHVVRRCVCDRVERIQSWHRTRQERTKRIRHVASWTGADEQTSGERDDRGKKGGKQGSMGSKPYWYDDTGQTRHRTQRQRKRQRQRYEPNPILPRLRRARGHRSALPKQVDQQ